jgi:hypothetical protein
VISFQNNISKKTQPVLIQRHDRSSSCNLGVKTLPTVDNPGDLTHTKLLKGRINETAIKNGAQLLYYAHRLAFNHLGNFEALQDATLSNIANGKFEENGYKYYEDTDISIQGKTQTIPGTMHCILQNRQALKKLKSYLCGELTRIQPIQEGRAYFCGKGVNGSTSRI